jgi:FkbM family methyltransferase
MGFLTKFLKHTRENYYVSMLLAGVARPAHAACVRVSSQLQKKVRKNGGTFVVSEGKVLRIARDAGVAIASILFWKGVNGFEPETCATLRFLFERAETFIDVGANYGFYSILAAVSNPKLHVISFEPVPEIYKGLRRNVHENQLEERVVCENLALANDTGDAQLYLPRSESKDIESTGTLALDSWQSRKGSPRVSIRKIRFDDYEKQHPLQLDVVKIDVEDFEADVLAGMRESIVRDKPFIVCEVLPRKHRNQRTVDIVETLGYQPYWITPSGYIRVSKFDFDRKDCNNFLFPPVSTQETVVDNLGVLWDLKYDLKSPQT